ncbi:MAG TPA: hypothetical protein VLM79_18440 [Kofleriaceae bacterium]|nr:hypothetical protein [Kofleriaceae bacterium]
MSAAHRIAAIPIVGAALALIAFGVARGAMHTGPAHGVRLRVTVDPPLDAATHEMAMRIVRDRLDERGFEVRVVAATEDLVVEIGEDDPERVTETARLLERTAKLELHAVAEADPWLAAVIQHAATDDAARSAGVRVADGVLIADDRRTERATERGGDLIAAYLADLAAREPRFAIPPDLLLAYAPPLQGDTWRAHALARAVMLEGRAIQRVTHDVGGVTIDASDSAAIAKLLAVRIAVLLDGKVKFVGTPDRMTATSLHLPTPGANQKEAFLTALDLEAIFRTGAGHPMHVVHHDAFTRTTGFVPRAWPLLVAALVLLVVAALVWRRR